MNIFYRDPTLLNTLFSVQGELIQATAHSTLTGPVPGKLGEVIFKVFHLIYLDNVGNNYTYRDAFDLVSTAIAPCGQSTILSINSDLRVSNINNPEGRGLLATDSVCSIYSISVLLLNCRFARRLIQSSIRYVIRYLLKYTIFNSS